VNAIAFKDPRYLLSETDPAKLRPCQAEVAFAGRSNVGKSSLLNALLGKPLAKVSQTPGRTRTINVYEAAPSRWLVDLPGYGFARGPEAERRSWRDMIEGYLTGRPSLRRVVVLVDAEVGPTALDVQMVEWLASLNLPYRAVASKADKVKPSRWQPRRREVAEVLGLAPEALAWVSASKGDGVDALSAALRADLA
jgi:GTP-binding protein